MGANYSFEAKNIEIWVLAFFKPNNSFIRNVKAKLFRQGTIHLRRRHVLGGEGVSPLPMFADARGVGV